MVGVAATAAAETVAGLIGLAVRGDEAAFATIVNRHHEDMIRLAFVVTGDANLAEEATAAAWPLVWQPPPIEEGRVPLTPRSRLGPVAATP